MYICKHDVYVSQIQKTLEHKCDTILAFWALVEKHKWH